MSTQAHPAAGRPAPPRLGQRLGVPTGHHTIIRDHTVTGTPAQIANLIANHSNAGRLIAMTPARPLPAPDSRVQVRMRLLDPHAPARTRPVTVRPPTTGPATGRRTVAADRRTRRIVALAVTAASVLAGVTAAVAYLIGQLVELITEHAGQILAALVITAILAALLGARRTTRHCPGC